MMPAGEWPMKRTFQIAAVAAVAAGAIFASGCGEQKPQVNNQASKLFSERCSGCHTLSAAATKGSTGARPTGPNLDYKPEDRNQVLFAIRNGGFSGAIMPQNIVVGDDAEMVADFVAKYAGSKAKNPPGPEQSR
jgi:mono/diheme cytochrome c family protein